VLGKKAEVGPMIMMVRLVSAKSVNIE